MWNLDRKTGSLDVGKSLDVPDIQQCLERPPPEIPTS